MAVNGVTVRNVVVDPFRSPVADPTTVKLVFVRTLPKSIDGVLELMPMIEAAKVPSIEIEGAASADVETTAAVTAASAIVLNVIKTPCSRCGDRIRPRCVHINNGKKLNRFIPQNDDFCES